LSARLTIEGQTHIGNELREHRIESMMKTQTNLTQISTGLVLLTAVVSVVTLVKEIWLSPPVIDKETKQLMKKQEQNSYNLERNLHRIDSTFQAISDSLKI
jgi:hypothetical protein